MFGIGILCFCYAPLLLLLKAPPTREEKKVSLEIDGIGNMAAEVSDDKAEKQRELTHAAENLFTKLWYFFLYFELNYIQIEFCVKNLLFNKIIYVTKVFLIFFAKVSFFIFKYLRLKFVICTTSIVLYSFNVFIEKFVNLKLRLESRSFEIFHFIDYFRKAFHGQ